MTIEDFFPKLEKLWKIGNEFYKEDLLQDAYSFYLKGHNIAKCFPKVQLAVATKEILDRVKYYKTVFCGNAA